MIKKLLGIILMLPFLIIIISTLFMTFGLVILFFFMYRYGLELLDK